jgi:WD40 repeat protein
LSPDVHTVFSSSYESAGGFHKGPILALDVCSMRPIVVTSGMDRTLRVWNYIKGRCDLVHDCKVRKLVNE